MNSLSRLIDESFRSLLKRFTDSRIFLPIPRVPIVDPPLFSKKGGGGTGMAAMKLEISEGGESVVYARLPKCILSEPGTRSVPRWFMVVIFGTILLRSL